jgi:hypothetical protein
MWLQWELDVFNTTRLGDWLVLGLYISLIMRSGSLYFWNLWTILYLSLSITSCNISITHFVIVFIYIAYYLILASCFRCTTAHILHPYFCLLFHFIFFSLATHNCFNVIAIAIVIDWKICSFTKLLVTFIDGLEVDVSDLML